MITNTFITKTTASIIAGILGAALLVGASATLASAQTTPIPLCEITRSLTVGSSGVDVQCLQRYLNWAGYTVAVNGAGSPGNETNYFGSLTADAVARWQNANAATVLIPVGLSAGTGFWGPSSFAHYVSIVKGALGV